MLRLSELYFIFYFTLGGSLLYFSNLFSSIGIDGKTSGLIFSSGSLIAMLFQPLMGILADKTKKNKEILSSLMLAIGIMSIVFYFYSNVKMSFIIFVLYSMAVFGVMPLIDGIAVSTTYPFGKLRLWGSIGFAAGSFISGKSISLFGNKSFLIVTLIAAISTIVIIMSLEKIDVKESEKANFKDIKNLMKNPDYLVFLMFTIIILGVVNAHNSYFSIYFTKIGGNTTFFGIVVFLLTMSEVPFMNLSARGTVKYGSKNLLVVAGVMCIVRWGVYYFFPMPNVIAGTFLLQGASIGIFFGLASAYIKTIVSKKTISTAITTFMAAGTLGGTILQLISGNILDKYGIESIYFMFFILCGIAVVVFIPGKKIITLFSKEIYNEN